MIRVGKQLPSPTEKPAQKKQGWWLNCLGVGGNDMMGSRCP